MRGTKIEIEKMGVVFKKEKQNCAITFLLSFTLGFCQNSFFTFLLNFTLGFCQNSFLVPLI